MTKIVSPADEAQIVDAVKTLAASGEKTRIKGGGTRSDIGNPVSAEQVLDVSGNEGIVIYDPGSLNMVAKAGTKMSAIDDALQREGQMLAFEPMDHRHLLGSKGEPTLGGMVAGNVSGPRRFLAGACRDHLLGARFVNGEGEIIKSGGRVMKNVTGLDLAKLQSGAFGSLGVLTELSFKTLPRPEKGITLAIENIEVPDAVSLFSKALNSPFEVSGAAWLDGKAVLRLEGFAIQVSSRTEQLKDMFSTTSRKSLQSF